MIFWPYKRNISDLRDTQDDHYKGSPVVAIEGAVQENNGEESSNNDNNPTHHLVHGGWNHCKCNKHQGRRAKVARSWNCQPGRVNVCELLLLYCLSHARREGHARLVNRSRLIAVNGALGKKKPEANELTDEHEHTLHVGVSKIVAFTVGVVLELHYHSVARSTDQHARHNAV